LRAQVSFVAQAKIAAVAIDEVAAGKVYLQCNAVALLDAPAFDGRSAKLGK